MTEIVFDVVGLPAPQGSKSAFVRGGRAVIVDGSSKTGREKHAQWRADVTMAARHAARGVTLTGPVQVTIEFFFALPKSDPHRVRHVTTPDVDKAARSVLDSLTNSALIRDDSQVFALLAYKHYALDGHFVGARIRVEDFSALEAADRDARKARARELRRARA